MEAVLEPRSPPVRDPLHLFAEDVTGVRTLELEGIDGYQMAGEFARSLAGEMDLPTSTPWALRDDLHGRMLRDDEPLGAQIEQESRLTVVPKSHLGSR